MSKDLEQLTLESIGGGAINKLFQGELEKVIKNVADEETEVKKERKIVIEVGFEPIDTRDQVNITLGVKSKLADRRCVKWGAQLQFDTFGVVDDKDGQGELFNAE